MVHKLHVLAPYWDLLQSQAQRSGLKRARTLLLSTTASVKRWGEINGFAVLLVESLPEAMERLSSILSNRATETILDMRHWQSPEMWDDALGLQEAQESCFFIFKTLAQATDPISYGIVHHPDDTLASLCSGVAFSLRYEKQSLLPFSLETKSLTDLSIEAISQSASEGLYLRYDQTGLQSLILQSFPGHSSSVSVLRKGGTYFIAGNGSLARLLARYLRNEYQATVLMCGRSELSDAEAIVLKDLGVTAYSCVDLGDSAATQKAWDTLWQKYGPINGVFYLAGLLEDSLWVNKTFESFAHVLYPKVQCLQTLDAVIGNTPIDLFLCFSSISGLVGSLGQCDYAAANAYMRHFCAKRGRLVDLGQRSGVTLAIDWGLWANGGMALGRKSSSMAPMATNEAFAAMESLLTSQSSSGVIFRGSAAALAPLTIKSCAESSLIFPSPEELEEWVMKTVVRFTKLHHLHPEESLISQGADSVASIDIAQALEAEIKAVIPDTKVSPTILFDFPTVRAISGYISKTFPQVLAKPAATENNLNLPTQANIADPVRDRDVAVIGISSRLPGAETAEAFWDNLISSRDSVGNIPYERWRIAESETVTPLQGGFISDIFDFDPLFFKISPKEAEKIDPQERLLLQEVVHALGDAGVPLTISARTGVFVAAMFGHYVSYLKEGDILDFSLASLANRISFCLDFHGPSIGLDTMCSGSLSAIHLACQSLRLNECDLAVVAGVNLMPHPAKYSILSQGKFLSTSGRCHSFGQGADGYVPGEGVGVLILKLARGAREDRDRIYGLIKGSALNSGGRTAGYTVPSPKGQSEVIGGALLDSAIPAEKISYVEAHGTGTALGDPIEVEALGKALEGVRRCALGSVKSNIGHLESAAGMASVIKVLLQFKYEKLVPTLHAEQLNPLLNLPNSPFYLVQGVDKWEKSLHSPRRAGVSSFGAGGANAHLILEEPPQQAPIPIPRYPLYILPLSAHSPAALMQLIGDLREWLQQQDQKVDAYSVCYGYSCSRVQGRYRKVFIFSDLPELAGKLGQVVAICDINAGSCFKGFLEWDGDPESLEKIAVAYESGTNIHWDSIYPLRVVATLPPYPFEKMRCIAPSFEQALRTYTGPNLSPEKALKDLHLFSHTWRAYDRDLSNQRSKTEPSHLTHLTVDEILAGEDFTNLFANLKASSDLIVIDARPLEACSEQEACKKLFLLGKLITQDNQPIKLVFILPMETRSTLLKGAPGFFKALVLEHHFLWIKLHYTRERDTKEEPLNTEQRFEEVKSDAGKYLVRTLTQTKIPSGGGALLRHKGVYLITGGMGKIGQLVTKFLLQSYQARIHLVGSTELTQTKLSELDSLRKGAGQVVYHHCDVTAKTEVAKVIKLIMARENGVLNGVIHAAGRTTDSLFRAKQFADFWDVVRIKTLGATFLDEETKNIDLDFFVLFSSISGVYGNIGQTDYSLANSALDNFSVDRELLVHAGKRSGKTLSINWPLWAGGGMTVPPEQIAYMKDQQGMDILPEDEGIKIFQALLTKEGDASVLMPIKGDLAKITTFSQTIFTATSPLQSADGSYGKLEGSLKDVVAQVANIPIERLDAETTLADYGFDSVSLDTLSQHIEQLYDIALPPSAFFTFNTIKKLSEYISSLGRRSHETAGKPSNSIPPLFSRKSDEPPTYAVVGMDGLMPGSSFLADFWTNLCAGHNPVVPMGRWQELAYHGAIIPNMEHFDAMFFGLSAREAMLMDPQHRLFLQVSYNTFLNAGYDPNSLKSVGVFAGIQFNDYQVLLQQWNQSRHPYAATGNAHAMLANRVSYLFDFNGPSQTVDTACSSALVAMRRAIFSLESGECDHALVGAVSLLIDPVVSGAAKSMGVLSPNFRCATFDAAADGYVRGEGVGCLLLRRYEDALRDGDQCHGLIIGSAENHGGRAQSLTAPNPEAQKNLLLTAYANRDIAAQLSAFEAHGTGTKLGDPIEVDALKGAWHAMGLRRAAHPVFLSSVKSHIGHLEPAAGIASLLKMLLCLKHKTLIGNLHFRSLNPYIQLDDSPFRVTSENMDWSSPSPRIAGISSFGFGGANAHVILQEAPPRTITEQVTLPAVLVCLSAKHPDSLVQMRRDLLTFLSTTPAGDPLYTMVNIAHTLQRGRSHFPYRWGWVGETKAGLLRSLEGPYQAVELTLKGECYLPLPPTAPESYRAELQNWLASYLDGYLPPWEKLYPPTCLPLPRVSLPTYRFHTQPYWFEQSADSVLMKEVVGD